MQLLAGLACLLAGGLAQASGEPINIKANQADIQKDVSTYSGDVRITQGSVSMYGARLAVERLGKDAQGKQQFQLTLRGNPASFDQLPTATQKEAIHGQASRISYRSSSRILTLVGSARLQRGSETVTGDTIEYDWQARRMLVNQGGTGGRVSITLDPDEVGN